MSFFHIFPSLLVFVRIISSYLEQISLNVLTLYVELTVECCQCSSCCVVCHRNIETRESQRNLPDNSDSSTVVPSTNQLNRVDAFLQDLSIDW